MHAHQHPARIAPHRAQPSQYFDPVHLRHRQIHERSHRLRTRPPLDLAQQRCPVAERLCPSAAGAALAAGRLHGLKRQRISESRNCIMSCQRKQSLANRIFAFDD
jgi:hypothetical protein